MLVSHRQKFIFLKTKKTAGTALEMALEPWARPENEDADLSHVTKPVETEAGIVGARGSGSVRNKWYNHMTAALVKERLDPRIWDSYVKIAAIRNPWDKVVSFFHMQRPRVKALPTDVIVAKFRQWLDEADKLGEDLDIYTIDGEPVVDEFIRYNRLSDDLARVCARIGIPAPELEVIKGNARGGAKIPYQTYYDDAARAIVAERFKRDIEIGGWDFENVERADAGSPTPTRLGA